MGRALLTLVTTLVAQSAFGAFVLFQVNMEAQIEAGNFDSGNGDEVVVRGSLEPLSWFGDADLICEPSISDPDIYEGVAIFDDENIGTTVEFKYVIKPNGGDEVWESRNNRDFEFTGENLALDVVYFDDMMGATDQEVAVTFHLTENDDCDGCTIDEMAIRGGSAPLDWGNDDTRLTDNGDRTWSVTVTFPAGSDMNVNYKFRAHADIKPDRFDEIGDPCTAWDPVTQWMWQDLRYIDPDCYANNFFSIDDSSPTQDIEGLEWFPHPTGLEGESPDVPRRAGRIHLDQNRPNPFNPATAIRFTLEESGDVDLTVYDGAGRRMALLVDRFLVAGAHTVIWRPEHAPSGVYVCRLQANGESMERTLLLVK